MVKKVTFAVVVLAVLFVTSAYAALPGEFILFGQSARTWSMGGTGIATTFDASAVNFNPANLGMLEIGYDGQPEKAWQFQGIGTAEISGDLDTWETDWAAKPVDSKWGIGASYFTIDGEDVDIFTFGAGYAYSETLSLGLGVLNIDSEGSHTLYSVGAAWKLPEVNIGLVIDDITDETDEGPFFAIGASKQLTEEILVSADLRDVTEEYDSFWNAGIEYTPIATPNLAVRAGMYEGGNMTFGAGWDADRWAVDASYVELDGSDDSISLSFSYKF